MDKISKTFQYLGEHLYFHHLDGSQPITEYVLPVNCPRCEELRASIKKLTDALPEHA